jgi:hypothetical protein
MAAYTLAPDKSALYKPGKLCVAFQTIYKLVSPKRTSPRVSAVLAAAPWWFAPCVVCTVCDGGHGTARMVWAGHIMPLHS